MFAGLKRRTYTVRYPRWMVGRPLLYSSSALASLGDAMFGYSQGIIAAAQVQPSFIRRMYGKDVTLEQVKAGQDGVDVYLQAIVVACLNIAALFASYLSAYICDRLGRRASIRIGGIIYFVASIVQIFMPNLTALLVGRCIQGLGVGMLSATVPIYQCEIAPGHGRGLFVSIEYLCLNAGYALSAWVGYIFFFHIPDEISWRGPYTLQACLALVLVIWTFFLPETPRWLIKNGFKREGMLTLADLHAGGDIYDPLVTQSYAGIEAAIILESHLGEATWGQLFTQYTHRTIIGITCQLFAQFNGINAILYFLPENLTRAGFEISRSLLYAGACALIYCAGTIPTMLLVDTWGRRRFLLTGSAGLVCALALVGGLQYRADKLPEGSAMTPTADGIFAGVCIYLFIFGATWGPIPWLLGAEIFPLRARAKGMALSTSVNWLSNFVVAFVTPPLFSSIQGGYYFLLLGFTCISGVFVYFAYPETAGKTLEELGEVFGDMMDAGAELGGRGAGDVEVTEKLDAPLEAERIAPIKELNSNVDLPEQEGGASAMHHDDESDEDEMVDVDVNSVDEEIQRSRELDGDVHRALLEASSEVTLLVAGDEVDMEFRAKVEGKKLEDVDLD